MVTLLGAIGRRVARDQYVHHYLHHYSSPGGRRGQEFCFEDIGRHRFAE
jgi:hypothetical protein